MAEALLVRSSAAAGCSAIARTMKRGELVAPGSSAMGLSSDFFCKKLASLVPKHSNTSGAKIRVGRGGPIRSKMFVPGFGEASPEGQAATAMHNFFTYVAVKIVCSQLEDYNKEAYADLMDFVERTPLKDGDKFIATLMRESYNHKNLALRIMEVRSAYANQDFEWEALQALTAKQMETANTSLMRKFLTETSNME